MKKLFFGLLISLIFLSESIFASQAKVRVHSDAVHDMAVFEMLQKIKAYIEILFEARVLLGRNNNYCYNNRDDWAGRGFYLKLNKDNFDKYGTMNWTAYQDSSRTESGFVLEIFDEKPSNPMSHYGIITPWGKFQLQVKFGEEILNYNISLKDQLQVRHIGMRQIGDGPFDSYHQYAMLSIGDMQLPSVVWYNDYCWQVYKELCQQYQASKQQNNASSSAASSSNQ